MGEDDDDWRVAESSKVMIDGYKEIIELRSKYLAMAKVEHDECYEVTEKLRKEFQVCEEKEKDKIKEKLKEASMKAVEQLKICLDNSTMLIPQWRTDSSY
jgi:hypothetical protein